MVINNSVNVIGAQMVGAQKKRPLKTFEVYKKISASEEDLKIDLRDSLDEQVKYYTLPSK